MNVKMRTGRVVQVGTPLIVSLSHVLSPKAPIHAVPTFTGVAWTGIKRERDHLVGRRMIGVSPRTHRSARRLRRLPAVGASP